MRLPSLKFTLIGLGLAGTMIFMLVVGTRSSSGFAYYVTVAEYNKNGEPHGQFRVNGKVEQGSIERLSSGRQVRFNIIDPDGQAKLPVDFTGIIPDTFVDKADVVVMGHRRQDGVFEATDLLAKCPSKYEAADGSSQASTSP
jgi:cytochrome c-type biogenesis protein CcmE